MHGMSRRCQTRPRGHSIMMLQCIHHVFARRFRLHVCSFCSCWVHVLPIGSAVVSSRSATVRWVGILLHSGAMAATSLCTRFAAACTYLKALQGGALYADAEAQQHKVLTKAVAQEGHLLSKEARQTVLQALEDSELPASIKDALRPLLATEPPTNDSQTRSAKHAERTIMLGSLVARAFSII